MQENEFFHWLQGYFELRADNEPLTEAQCECIGRHIAMVQAVGKTASPILIEVRTMANMLLAGLDAKIVTVNMAAKVSEMFEHVIDPM